MAVGSIYKLSAILHEENHPFLSEFNTPLETRLGTCTDQQAFAAFFVPEFKDLEFVDATIKTRAMAAIKAKMPALATNTDRWHKKAKLMTELEYYLEDTDYHTTPLHYWKSKKNDCPTLAAMAMDFLLIMGSSASAERLFNGAADIEKRKRWNLLTETLEGYVLCKSGFKNKLIKFI